MKVFAIWDKERENKTPIGYLLYYEKESAFIIELSSELDEWDSPLLFSFFVKKGIFTIPKDISALWVRERVIPSGRQNIGSILKNHKMTEYNEMKLLALSKGECSQDSCYIKEITYDEIPEEIRTRSEDNVEEACEMLQCSKQNLTYLIKTGKIEPIRQESRENMFYKGNIEKIKWG